MKLFRSFVTSSPLCVASITAASVGHVYLLDPEPSTPAILQSPALSPETARLIFAQRLGLSRYHTLNGADATVLQYINDFGGPAQKLFGQAENDDQDLRAMIIVEDVEDPQELVPSWIEHSAFTIDNPPSASANWDLVSDFALQAEELSASTGQAEHNLAVSRSLKHVKKNEVVKAGTTFVQITSLSDAIASGGVGSEVYKRAQMKLRMHIQDMSSFFKDKGVSFTLALMPPGKKGIAKRSARPYGNYELPRRLAKAQRQQPEAPLSAAAPAQASSDIKATATSGDPETPANSTTPVRGILPACFSSLSACESATNNCTGHGQCKLKYKSGNDDTAKPCYSCVCTPQVRTNKDGSKKTTMFGGPACQKKDVTMPFWLLAGFTVIFVFIISWGIGLLYGMGNEELPSVIGAGVSGPRPK